MTSSTVPYVSLENFDILDLFYTEFSARKFIGWAGIVQTTLSERATVDRFSDVVYGHLSLKIIEASLVSDTLHKFSVRCCRTALHRLFAQNLNVLV